MKEGDRSTRADICIVGAGAAGITLARELDGGPLDVLLIESSREFDADTQALNRGTVSGLSYLPLEATRLRYFGGTTNHWAGQSTPLNSIDFDHRPWVASSGWPIEHAELLRYLPRALDVCKLGVDEFDNGFWREQLSPPICDDRFEPVVFGFPDPVTRFGTVYGSELAASRNVRVLFGANATDITLGEGGTVRTIAFSDLTGRTFDVRARRFVLACGTLQNIKLLLNADRQEPGGLGNRHGLLGRFFMEHPSVECGELTLDPETSPATLTEPFLRSGDSRIRLDYRLGEWEQQRRGILNHSVFLTPRRRGITDDLGDSVSRLWRRVEDEYGRLVGRQSFALRVRLEHAPRSESRVTLNDERDPLGMRSIDLHLQLGQLEARTVRVVADEFANRLGALDLGRLRSRFDPDDDAWQSRVSWQQHHMGGTRMGRSPPEGVVDSNCAVFGHENLYIAGSSVFPTAGQANPTLNLVALTLRLADHLKSEAQHRG